MEPELRYITVNGAELAYFERGTRRDDRPSLFFVHATGFHARVWDYHAAAFPDLHIVALDQRGHGRSAKLAVDHWQVFGEDQAAVVSALGLAGAIGIGHSMGAHAMIDGAAKSGAFGRLLLLDPTVASLESYAAEYAGMFGDELHPAAKRRNVFESPEDMLERISGKSSFPLFHPRILRDYVEHGLEQVESGEFRLCCEPEIEAHVYMAARSNGEVYESIEALDIPVTIVRAKLPDPHNLMDWGSSPTWPGLAQSFKQGRDIHWETCSHFIPMERPDEVVALIKEEVAAC